MLNKDAAIIHSTRFARHAIAQDAQHVLCLASFLNPEAVLPLSITKIEKETLWLFREMNSWVERFIDEVERVEEFYQQTCTKIIEEFIK